MPARRPKILSTTYLQLVYFDTLNRSDDTRVQPYISQRRGPVCDENNRNCRVQSYTVVFRRRIVWKRTKPELGRRPRNRSARGLTRRAGAPRTVSEVINASNRLAKRRKTEGTRKRWAAKEDVVSRHNVSVGETTSGRIKAANSLEIHLCRVRVHT